jgi:hypothetical protein
MPTQAPANYSVKLFPMTPQIIPQPSCLLVANIGKSVITFLILSAAICLPMANKNYFCLHHELAIPCFTTFANWLLSGELRTLLGANTVMSVAYGMCFRALFGLNRNKYSGAARCQIQSPLP